MFLQAGNEPGPAARILLLKGQAALHGDVFLGEVGRAAGLEIFGNRQRQRAKVGARAGLGAVAAAADRQRQRPVGVGNAEMQRREAAHRKAHDMRVVDTEMIEHRQRVVTRDILRIAGFFLRDVGARIPACRIDDATTPPAEMADLWFPRPPVAGEFVDEQDRRPVAGFLVIELHPVSGSREWHVFLQSLRQTSLPLDYP